MPAGAVSSKNIRGNVIEARDSVIPSSATLFEQIDDEDIEASDMRVVISPRNLSLQQTRHSAQRKQSKNVSNGTIHQISRHNTSEHLAV